MARTTHQIEMVRPVFKTKTDITRRHHTHVAADAVRVCLDSTSKYRMTFGRSFADDFSAYRYVSIYEDAGNVFFWFNNKNGMRFVDNSSNTLRTQSSREIVETLIVPFFQIPEHTYYRDIALTAPKRQPKSGHLYVATPDKVTLF